MRAIAIAQLLAMSMRSLSRPTLMVVSRSDPASVNMLNALLDVPNAFQKIQTVEGEAYKGSFLDPLYLWVRDHDEPMLALNDVNVAFDELIESSPKDYVGDVLFLSRHSAASGRKSLTIHPIGIPWSTDTSRSGGFPGRCSPPNPRIAPLYRDILQAVKDSEDANDYEVTLEVTHHGPFCSVPACFVEIG